MAYFIITELNNLRIPWYGRPLIEDWIKLKQFIYERDKGICQYCHKPVEYHFSHCHHIKELSEFGTNHPTNLKTLCVVCHKKRHPHMKSIQEKMLEFSQLT
jgi:5-methylcytosine-specific restriction enzyme A